MSAQVKLATNLKPLDISVVLPCLNEAETIGTCVQKATSWLDRAGINGEVIVADNGSTDGSQEIARKLGAKVVAVPTKGYGSALAGGFGAASGKYIIMADSDDSYDLADCSQFVTALDHGYDLVIGNRFQGGIKADAMPFLHKYLGNPVLSAIGRMFFSIPIGDFHCGLRAFRKTSLEKVGLSCTGMEFASEMIVKSSLHGLKLTEVPTTLSPAGRSRPPHLRTWRDGWRHLRFMMLYSPEWIFFYPGLLLFVLGTAAAIPLSFSWMPVGTVVFDIGTLLYAWNTIILGYLAICFAACARTGMARLGLLPESKVFNRLYRYVNLETGIVVGSLLILGGIIGTFYGVLNWNQHNYKALDPAVNMRIIIPSVGLLVLGCQTILCSFLLSMFGITTKK